MNTAPPRRAWRTYLLIGGGAFVVIVLGCVACGFSADPLLFHNTESETVFEAECDGTALSVTYEYDRNMLMGVNTNRRALGTWGGDEFPIDNGAMPRHLRRWSRPTFHSHEGQIDGYLHFFLGGIEGAPDLERCLEANQAAIIAALDDTGLAEYRSVAGRGRVYWQGRPEDLVPEFTHDGRTLELRRDGVLWLREGSSGSGMSIGSVETRADKIELLCCERYADLDASALPRFVDDERQSLIDRLGVPVTSLHRTR